jgi:hypothetical protein
MTKIDAEVATGQRSRLMKSVPSSIAKTYPQRGPLQQFRFADTTAFTCFRCGQSKKSKLITVYRGDWSKRLCNGCYGRLLSLYEIKAGTAADDERAGELAAALLATVSANDQQQSERLFRVSEERAERLSPEAVRFIVTAEHVAGTLEHEPQLEWSPAVIGLCKAFEMEIVCRMLRPLSVQAAHEDLQADKNDKDIGRIAAFCADPTRKPPELGAFSHFLQTAINSKERRETSTLLRCFFKLAANWSSSHWLLEQSGLHETLVQLTSKFRNRAAHIDELGKQDYDDCRELVIGSAGAMWKFLLATERHK